MNPQDQWFNSIIGMSQNLNSSSSLTTVSEPGYDPETCMLWAHHASVAPSSKVKFNCEDGIIAFNNAASLLENTNDLYHPMLGFLSNCEVDEATKTISFSLSSVEKPLTFTQNEFITAIGLHICSNVVPLPPKETVRAGLATLGLCDKDKPNLSSTVLVNSSPLKINETVATADATKSLDTFKSAEEQANQPKNAESEKEEVKESGLESMKDVTFDQIINEIDQKNKAAKNPESSFDTESEIRIIKRFQPSQFDDNAQITFLGAEPYNQTKSTDGDSDSELRFMPDDDLVFLTGFETPDSADDDFKEGTGETFYAFVDMPAQLDPLSHLHEDLCILNNKIDQVDSSITKKVTDDIQSLVPLIVADSLKENLPSLLSEALQNTLPQLIKESIKQSVSESIEEKLPVCYPSAGTEQIIKTKLEVSVKKKDLRIMYKDMVFLLEVVEVFKKANVEGERRICAKMPKLKSFIALDEQLTQEDIIAQVKEMKRLADLKAKKDKSEESLKRIMNLTNIKAQAQKIAEYEAKRAKMLKEYNDCLNQRADELPITKIKYRVSFSNNATMRITRGNDPLNVDVHDKVPSSHYCLAGQIAECHHKGFFRGKRDELMELEIESRSDGRHLIYSAGLYKFACKLDTLSSLLVQRVFWAIWKCRNKIVSAHSDSVSTIKDEDIFPSIQRLSKIWITAQYSHGNICNHFPILGSKVGKVFPEPEMGQYQLFRKVFTKGANRLGGQEYLDWGARGVGWDVAKQEVMRDDPDGTTVVSERQRFESNPVFQFVFHQRNKAVKVSKSKERTTTVKVQKKDCKNLKGIEENSHAAIEEDQNEENDQRDNNERSASNTEDGRLQI
nr:hypothetical protein [Tanacetum cinerariifolium]